MTQKRGAGSTAPPFAAGFFLFPPLHFMQGPHFSAAKQ